MDRLEAMQLFVTTVETGSFSGASRKLGIPLPTVSRKVSELEDHLKSRLLIRTTRKLSLTDAGAAYLASSKRILDDINAAETLASGEYTAPRGELILTAPITFGRFHVLGIVNDFLKAYPDINVRMSLSDRAVNLSEDNIDMAVRIGALPDSSMIATRVGTVRRVVVGSPEYFAKHGMPKQLSDLVDLTCVTFAALSGNSSWVFPGKGRSASLPVRPTCRLNINTAESAIDAAIAGIGVTHVISYQVARLVAEGKLQVVLQEFEPEPMPVHLIHAAQGRLPLKMRSFLEFAAPRLRKSLDSDEAKLATKPIKPTTIRPPKGTVRNSQKEKRRLQPRRPAMKFINQRPYADPAVAARFFEYKHIYPNDPFSIIPMVAPNLSTGRARLHALLGVGASYFIDVRDPLQEAYERFAARAEELAA